MIFNIDYATVFMPASIHFIEGGVERMRIHAGGNVGIGTGSGPTEKLHVVGNILATGTITGTIVDVSSKDLKKNIEDLSVTEAVGTLEDLKPVKFKFKAEDENDLHIGFVAEDVPALVATPDRKGVSPMDIVAVLTKVVQEQNKTIAEMQKKIQALEDQHK